MNMIELTGINKIYRTNEIETQALENVNLNVEKGEFLSIMGPSGCGKSTLLNIMGLLDAPTSGTIRIAGTLVEGMKDKELAAFRNKNLGFVFQGTSAPVPECIGEGTPSPGRRSAEESRIESPYASHADPALRWSVPACGHCPCHHRKSGNHPGRRAYR